MGDRVLSVSPESPFSLCSQVLGHPVSDQHLPDVSLIGEFSNPAELGKLLQLVLGCAISCEKKQGMRRVRGEEAGSTQRVPRENASLQAIPGLSLSPSPSSPEYIQRIMTLEESVQHVVMEAIQEVGEGIPCGNPQGSGEETFLG